MVDDNSEMRSYLRRVLAGHFDVETVADGQAALAAIRSSRPDLVLTDVMMPDSMGSTSFERSGPIRRPRGLPVIMLSARAGRRALSAGLTPVPTTTWSNRSARSS